MKSKSLVKWTIGPTCPEGIDCLFEAVKEFKNLYKDRFNYVVCHNQLSTKELKRVKSIDVPLFDRNNYAPARRYNPYWKLCPPRLSPDTHEISIDNDLILYKRPQKLEQFLECNDSFIITEDSMRCFGVYDEYVPEGLQINTGLYGLPPKFNLKKELDKFEQDYNNFGWCDEQGLTAAIITSKKYILLTLDEISVCSSGYKKGKFGTHFAGLNHHETINWDIYREAKLKLL